MKVLFSICFSHSFGINYLIIIYLNALMEEWDVEEVCIFISTSNISLLQ